ncbi:MAG: hypothetical protein GX968_08840 [Tissierellia bacterium]|nr:hypothetical protein [Tissierellia bacterium]
MVLVLLIGLFGNRIQNNKVYKYSIYATLVISGLEVLGKLGFGIHLTKLESLLPFASQGFPWVVPALVVGIMACVFRPKGMNTGMN